jgi:hypothetical protein
MPFPEIFAAHCEAGAYADGLGESDPKLDADSRKMRLIEKKDAEAEAQEHLRTEIDTLLIQGQKFMYVPFRLPPQGRICVSPPWSGGGITVLGTVGASVREDYRSEIVAIRTVDGIPSLEGLKTVGVYLPGSLVTIVIGVQRLSFKLFSGTADPLDPGQVTPEDDSTIFWAATG